MKRCLTSNSSGRSRFARSALRAGEGRAQNLPEIPYESVPNFRKLPSVLYIGEPSASHQFEGHSSPTRAAPPRGFRIRIERRVRALEAARRVQLRSRHSVRVDPHDNIWVVDEGTNTIVRFNIRRQHHYGPRRRPPAFLGPCWPRLRPPPLLPASTVRASADVAWGSSGNIFISDAT